MNLLQETIDDLSLFDKSPDDVSWVGTRKQHFTWDEFCEIANVEYDDGFGTNEIRLDLFVVGADWWLERDDCNGSEQWLFKRLPRKPGLHKPLESPFERDS